MQVSLDCVIYCAFYSVLFRGVVFSGHGVDLCSMKICHIEDWFVVHDIWCMQSCTLTCVYLVLLSADN